MNNLLDLLNQNLWKLFDVRKKLLFEKNKFNCVKNPIFWQNYYISKQMEALNTQLLKTNLGFLSIVIAAAVVFLTTKNVNQDQNVNLSGLMQLNTANAECKSDPYNPSLNDGHCYQLSGNCFWGIVTYMDKCDPWAMGS